MIGFKNLSDGKKSAVIGLTLILLLFGFIFTNRYFNNKKLNSNYQIIEAVVTDVKLNVSKGTTQTQNVYTFEFHHQGKKIKKIREFYNSEKVEVGQRFKIRIHPEDSNLYTIEKN